MVYCEVKGCKNNLYKKLGVCPEVSFFRFPNDVAMKMKWLSVINLRADDYCNSYRVCSLHFKSTDFKNSESATRKLLKKTAVPSEKLPISNDKENLGKNLPMDFDIGLINKTECRSTTAETGLTRNFVLPMNISVKYNEGRSTTGDTDLVRHIMIPMNITVKYNEGRSTTSETNLAQQEMLAMNDNFNILNVPSTSKRNSVPEIATKKCHCSKKRLTFKSELHTPDEELKSQKKLLNKYNVLKETIKKRNKTINGLYKLLQRKSKTINSLEKDLQNLRNKNLLTLEDAIYIE